MKSMIVVLMSVLFAQGASAKGFDFKTEVQKRFMKVAPMESNAEPAPEVPPTRMVPTKVSVTKTVVHKNPSGEYEWSTSTVCIMNMDVPLSDLRNRSGSFSFKEFSCQSEYKGQPVEIRMYAAMNLHVDALHPDEGAVPVKIGYGGGFLIGNGTPEDVGFDSAISRDLSANDMLVGTGQYPSVFCQVDDDGNRTCSATREEAFAATFEFMDHQ